MVLLTSNRNQYVLHYQVPKKTKINIKLENVTVSHSNLTHSTETLRPSLLAMPASARQEEAQGLVLAQVDSLPLHTLWVWWQGLLTLVQLDVVAVLFLPMLECCLQTLYQVLMQQHCSKMYLMKEIYPSKMMRLMTNDNSLIFSVYKLNLLKGRLLLVF